MKSIPKHEPTSRYYHLVGCIAECVLRCGEDNQHMHGVYTEETAPSSKVNNIDEEKSKEFIVHEPVLENLSMDVRKSECDIVNETLSQKNSSNVPTNVIT